MAVETALYAGPARVRLYPASAWQRCQGIVGYEMRAMDGEAAGRVGDVTIATFL